MYVGIPNSPWIPNWFYIVLSQKKGHVKNNCQKRKKKKRAMQGIN